MSYLNETGTSERTYNLLITGPSGSGKSTLGVTAPDPVILLTEGQGFVSIQDAARRLRKPVPPTFHVTDTTTLLRDLRDLRDGGESIPRLLARRGASKATIDALPYRTPRSVVVDSMTEVMKLISDGIEAQSPPKIASDGLPERTPRYWGVYKDRAVAILRRVRDLPTHTIMLALEDDRETGPENAKVRTISPMLGMRGLPQMALAMTNAAGLISVRLRRDRKGGDSEMVHQVRFAGPSYMCVKPMRPLRDIEGPDVSDWIARLDAGVSDERAEDPLDGSDAHEDANLSPSEAAG